MLDDFTEANGATRVVPGSHRFEDPMGYVRAGGATVAAEGAAGTALIFDGRLLHGTGANTSAAPRRGLIAYFCQPFVRQQENFMLSLDPALRAAASDELLALLGFRCWNTLGMVEGTAHRRFASEADRIGALDPARPPERREGIS
jgi:ectoine hydroxylase-related dioxygenase (phytanoyl-CoA dioxygenase family)